MDQSQQQLAAAAAGVVPLAALGAVTWVGRVALDCLTRCELIPRKLMRVGVVVVPELEQQALAVLVVEAREV
jgi:hypothetical protein